VDILEELRRLQQQFKPPTHTKTGDSYISDAVVHAALYKACCDESIINDVLLEPVESRESWINYFETVGRKK
jgi:hypothetical protein